MSELRKKFVEVFGEWDASLLEEACDMHIHAKSNDPLIAFVAGLFGDSPENHEKDDRGSDPFRYVILTCLGYECVTNDGYRRAHALTLDPFEFMKWCITEADLESFDGDQPDHLAMAITQLTRFQQQAGDIPE